MFKPAEFSALFVITLVCAGVLAALGGTVALVVWGWPRLQNQRNWLATTRFALFAIGLCFVAGSIMSRMASLTRKLASLIARSFRGAAWLLVTVVSAIAALALASAVPGFFASLPFLIFWQVGISLSSTLGIIAAGSAIGLLAAPYMGWQSRSLGILKATGMSLLTIFGGGYAACWLIALLIAMASD